MSEPSPPPPVPFITLPNWVKAAARCGFNIEPLFREVGIATNLLDLGSVTVDPDRLRELMDACVARSRGAHFPFVLGEQFAFEYLPDMETFISTSPTLREAARVFDWVRQLIDPLLQVTVAEEGDQARLELQFIDRGRPLEPLPHFAEAVFSCVVKFGRSLIGDAGGFERIGFRHAPPPYAGEYEKFFTVPVAFGQPVDALHFARALLDRPLPGAYPELHKQAEYLVGQRLLQRPGAVASGLSAQLDAVLSRRLDLLGGGIDAAAAVLALHPRTLQRRLQDEGSSYADRLAKLRFALASDWLLHGDLDIESISERLGFSDRRSFTQAFTRWSGLTPSAFRNKGRRNG
jgi:AraC-like DNA-binding protein